MNAHFVPQFFICLQAVNTQNTGLQGPLACPYACSYTSRFSLSGFLRHGPGIVIKNIWRSTRCKVEEHNTNSADKIFCLKEITAVYIRTFPKFLVFWSSNDNTATDICVGIVDVCIFQVVISHCCGKLTHADTCQCGGDFNTQSQQSHKTFFVFFWIK